MNGLAFEFGDFEDHADIGMAERGGGLRFALETGEGLRVSGEFAGEKF